MKSIVIATVLSVFVATPALAAKSRAYYDSYDQGSSASTRVSKGYIGLAAGKNTVAADTSTTWAASTAGTIFGGYSFNDKVAAELSYTNLGSADTDPASTISSTGSLASLSLVGSLPLGKVFSLFAKVGYGQSKIDITDSSTATTTSETNSGAVYGAGALINMGQRAALRLSYDKFKVGSTTPTDSSLVSAGVLFKF